MVKGREGRLELAWVACLQDQQAHPENTRRSLQFSRFALGKNGVGRIYEVSERSRGGHQFVQQRKAFGRHRDIEAGYSREIAASPVETGNEASPDRVDA
jgi:hypothetical protein